MKPDSGIKKISRLGIVGGTFDPIHFGHLITAETVRETMKLDQILFIPAGIPPHKLGNKVSESRHRYRMAILATEDNPDFAVSDLEINREGPSYTVDTVTQLNRLYGETVSLFFMIGADALLELSTWKQPEDLLASCKLIVMTRPGYQNERLLSLIESYNQKEGVQGIKLVEVPHIGISSTLIRNRVKANLSIKYLLPESVENYIVTQGLYLNR